MPYGGPRQDQLNAGLPSVDGNELNTCQGTNTTPSRDGGSNAGDYAPRRFLHRIAWFIAIWAASVAALSLVAALIRLAL